MKVDANGTVRKSGASGDFRAGHAFDEAEDKSFAIGFGEWEDGVESSTGFGGGMRTGSRSSRLNSSGFFHELVDRLAAAMKIGGAITSDRGEPAREFGDFTKRREARKSLQKNVLDEIVYIGGRNAREKDGMNHAGVTGIEEAKRGAIALLGSADEVFVVNRDDGRRVHDELSWEWGAGVKLNSHGYAWASLVW
jgi:hypothetical protein